MGPSDLRGRRGRVGRAAGQVFGLTAARLLRPLVRQGAMRWSLLIGRPDDGGACLVGSVVREQAGVRL